MWLKRLALSNFRNHKNLNVEFCPGVNLIQGKNGLGKTNLLEALHLISTGRSFRTAHLSDLICHGAPAFHISAEFERDGIEQSLTMSFDGTARKLKINATKYSNFSNALGLLPSVLYAPYDHALIAGAPADRRRFLNIHIAQTDPVYVHYLMRYSKALKQRNALLKTKQEASIEVWEAQMAQSGSYLINRRQKAIQTLGPHLKPYIERLSDDDFSICFQPSLTGDLCAQWKAQRKKDMLMNTTLLGPHRDDLAIQANGKSAKAFSSEGQKRSCLAALKLAQWNALKEEVEDLPLLAIDDFGVHLDETRTARLWATFKGLGQVFLTTPLKFIRSADKIINIQSGGSLTICKH